MKIIKRKVNITHFIDKRVLKCLKEKNMLDFYVINLFLQVGVDTPTIHIV